MLIKGNEGIFSDMKGFEGTLPLFIEIKGPINKCPLISLIFP
jgi:hypothetical protein